MIRFGYWCCFCLWFAFVCECFVLDHRNVAGARRTISTTTATTTTATTAAISGTSSNINSNDKQAGQSFLVVLDSDSILDTIDHRSTLGIKTALCAWPKLKEEQVLQESDQSWLLTKLSALSMSFQMNVVVNYQQLVNLL